MNSQELKQTTQSGTLNESAARLEKSRAQALARGDTKQSAVTSNDLGVLYYLGGRKSESRAAFELARIGFTKLNDSVGQARALGNLARLEENSGNPKAAMALYEQAVDLFHEGNERSDEFATLRLLSQLFLKQGGWLQALAAFDRALTVKPHRTLFDSFLHRIYQIPLQMMLAR